MTEDQTKRGGIYDATIEHEVAIAIGEMSPAVWEFIQKRHEAEVIVRLAASSGPLTMTAETEKEWRRCAHHDAAFDEAISTRPLEAWAEIDALRALVAVLQARSALDFDTLQQISVARCESPDNGFNQKIDEWTLLEWAGAMCGEAGEAANVAKKLRRKRAQRGDDKVTVELLGEELSDTVCYAILTAARAGINLGDAVVAKFNKVSKEVGSTWMLRVRRAA